MILISISSIGTAFGANTTENNTQTLKNLYITADKSEITVGESTNIEFTVTTDGITPVDNAIIIIDNGDLGKGITNKNGISIINVNVPTVRTLRIKADKSGYTGASMTINTVSTYVPPKEGKFRVGPTVRIRPLNDVINKSADGLVELYMDNPSLNDVTLNVDMRVSVPSGIHVYGQGFGDAGAAGTVYGKFDVPPGKARTIYMNIKAEKTGNFIVQFSGLYWPGDNKDEYQPISLTHPLSVYEASSNPTKPDSPNSPEKRIPGISIIMAISVIIILTIVLRKR